MNSKKSCTALLKWLLKRAGYLRKELQNIVARLIYQPQSYFVLHKWNGHKCPYEPILFYNFTGRILFAAKELLALVSRNRIARKSIRLEGFESVDFRTLYHKGSDAVLWPKSPMVMLEKRDVPAPFFDKMERSYHLALQQEHMGKPEWWEQVARNIRAWILDTNGKLKRQEVVDFRKESRFEEIITDQFTYVDTRKGYFGEYLKAIDVVLEYHRFAQHIRKEILASFSESYVGNNRCIVYRGKRLSEKSLFYATCIEDITANIPLASMHRCVICDIGTGYGGLPAMLRYYVQRSCQILIDIPEVVIFTAYYIRYNFPDAKIALLEDLQKSDFSILLAKYDFIIIPPEYISQIPDASVDLVTNTASLGFLNHETTDLYLSEIARMLKGGGYFYSVNQTSGKEAGIGTYEWDFKAEYLTILLSYSNRFAYPQWLGQKQ